MEKMLASAFGKLFPVELWVLSAQQSGQKSSLPLWQRPVL